jgi:hypothetical protein
MGGDGDTALAMNVLDNLRGRLSPRDVLAYSHAEQMKTRCCNLFANKNCRPTYEAGIPPTSLGREEPIVVRNCKGVQPLMTSKRNQADGREHAVRQETVYVKIRFDNIITAASHNRSIRRITDECPPYQADYH